MQIESIEIRNYRLFRQAELRDLPRLNVVVGANGSGKSTLFDVFSFLKEALAEAFGNAGLRGIGDKARYRDPDAIVKPSKEIVKLIPEFQKISGARRMTAFLSRKGNRSRSYQVLMEGIERILQEEVERK